MSLSHEASGNFDRSNGEGFTTNGEAPPKRVRKLNSAQTFKAKLHHFCFLSKFGESLRRKGLVEKGCLEVRLSLR